MNHLAHKGIEVKRMTKGKLPSLPFVSAKEAILGKNYELSIVFVGAKKSHALNLQYRGKDKPTNVLSFPNSKTSGELIFCLSQVRKDAPDFEQSYEEFLVFLFIHGLLHLKGFDHGSRMESEERKFLKKFSSLTTK